MPPGDGSPSIIPASMSHWYDRRITSTMKRSGSPSTREHRGTPMTPDGIVAQAEEQGVRGC
jgi:hypothetical protein